jgi:hypothetical protein
VRSRGREQISFGLRGIYDELAKIDPRNDGQMPFYDQTIAGDALLGFVAADRWVVALPISKEMPAVAATMVNPEGVSEGDFARGDHSAGRGTTSGDASRPSVSSERQEPTTALRRSRGMIDRKDHDRRRGVG